jgi:hypothetical protein
MHKNIILIILLLMICYINNDSCIFNEKFDILSDNNFITNHSYKSDNTQPQEYISELTYQPKITRDCCLVEKKYVPDVNNEFGGNFKYKYKKLSNENCDLKLFRLDNNKQLFFENENNWSNEKCNNNIINGIGSCRNVNKECIDFVDKTFCDQYKMTWSKKTCNNSLNYKWHDTQKNKLPQKAIPFDGTFKMF